MTDIQDNISGENIPVLTDKILAHLQAGLTITDCPFSDLAQKLCLETNSLLDDVNQLVHDGVIREISPVFNARKMGYTSTLVAASVPEMVVPDFVKRVNTLPGVSHNYARQHKYNTWFTLTVPRSVAGADPFEPILSLLHDEFQVDEIISLPSQKMYKLKVEFSSASASGITSESDTKYLNISSESGPISISTEEKQLIRELQNGIPVIERPFETIAKAANTSLGSDVFNSEKIVRTLSDWQEQGAIRRIAGRVRHKKVGYQSNAMVVFKVAADIIDQAGHALAAKSCVSHCYHRRTTESWQYNLYAMTHAKSEAELNSAVCDMVELIKPDQYDVLNTVNEHKKQSVKYFV